MKELLLSLKERLRILPLLVVVASLAFIVRVGDAALQVKSLSGSAFAQSAPATKPAAEVKDATPPPEPAAPEVKAAEKPGEIELPSAAAPAWSDAADADIDYSNLRKELYQDLLQRRQQLDEKEKALSQREALLDASQQEITKKFEELTGLRDEIQNLLKKQSEEETARIASLVKIYEGMKAKDAARIFNTLDMDILLDVVSKMSERKSAPIIAEMDAERARGLTTMLAEQRKLPELPSDAIPPLPAN